MINSANQLIQNILFSCEKQKSHVAEQVVPEHVLVYVVSGNVEFLIEDEHLVAEPGSIILIRRNRLTKATKIPDPDVPCKSINIFLTQEIIRTYALQNSVGTQERYAGKPLILLNRNKFLKGYFDSLIPYLHHSVGLNSKMAKLKTDEAIELLLTAHHSMESFLFDLSEPHRIDLEKFISANFMFNVPISEFARLTGRSLSTFKRDFKNIYHDTPEKWLRERRLNEARRLIVHEGKKPSEVYYQVGFENFSHFSAAYKQLFGHNASDTQSLEKAIISK
ncbi:MAG: AraC family transcriptional regulator [Prevotellaceae bacterium]|jgi:AraC-like DNA-binding protein|nr:AraC family transcriptional regulator [Prevotellaceae bacterium]